MKTILVALITLSSALLQTSAFAADQANCEITDQIDEKYNIINNHVRNRAAVAKLSAITQVAQLSEVVRRAERDSKAKDDSSVCFQVGPVMSSINLYAVGYGVHSKDPNEVAQAKAMYVSVLKLAHLCQVDKELIVNPEYVKTAFGEDLMASIDSLDNFDHVNSEISFIQEMLTAE